jgi:hypothetical protein
MNEKLLSYRIGMLQNLNKHLVEKSRVVGFEYVPPAPSEIVGLAKLSMAMNIPQDDFAAFKGARMHGRTFPTQQAMTSAFDPEVAKAKIEEMKNRLG